MYKAQGKKVILGAADTFRAAAIDQLDVWAQRAGVDIVKHKEGADPAAVVYDTIDAGIARDCDIIILDTAGRLHNKKHLMEELAKIFRVMDKKLPYADREVLLVLDAVTGQNAVNQAREFAAVTELTGIVLTKLDGTARGGVVLSIKNDLKIPVKFIGVGEGIDDLQPFDPEAFARSLFEEGTKKEEDENENSLEGLINSEEYKNYTPPAEESNEGLEELAAAAGEILAELYGEPEGEPEEQAGGDDAGQADAAAAEAEPEEAYEAPEQAEEAVCEDAVQPAESVADRLDDAAAEEVTAEEPAAEPVTPAAEEPVFVPEPVPAEEPVTAPAPQPAPQEEPKKKERRGFFGLFNRKS
jgi:hypothetical protein